MRILLYSINYAPELTGIGKYNFEMVEWLTAKGHQVKVVTAPPYYPEWRVASGYSALYYRRETREGADVWRCPLWVPERPSGLMRVIHLASFAVSSFPVLFTQVGWRPDVLMVVEPPLFCSPAALIAAKLFGSISWLHVQDFEVDAAFELGFLRKGILQRLVLRLEKWLMSKFDVVSTISDSMRIRLIQKGVEPANAILFPNWVDLNRVFPDRVAGQQMRDELNINSEVFVLLYSGNIGEKQGLDILIRAAKSLADNNNILFVICGEGSAKDRLQQEAFGLSNVRFLPLQPVERLNALLNIADVHLLPQRADAADLVMPSKLTGILACGGPVIATTRLKTELANVVTSAGGLVVSPDDEAELVEKILQLFVDSALRSKMALQARQFAQKNIGREALLQNLEQQFLNKYSNSRRSDSR